MTEEERKKLIASMKEEAAIRQKITESSAEYLKLMKDIKNLHKNIATAEEAYNEQFQKILKARKAMVGLSGKDLDNARESLEIEIKKARFLKEQVADLKESAEQMTRIAKEAGKMAKSMAVLTQTKNDVTAIVGGVKKSYNLLKGWAGLFEIDKSIRTASLSMGLLNKRTDVFRDSLQAAGNNTISFGVGIKELAALQANYSQELGRSVTLTQTGLEAMGEMAAATGLGAEGTAKMAADFEQQGLSAERTRDFVEQTMNDSSKMGLDASKVVKNIQQNVKLLNRYNFKGGVKGLAKMAETTTKLGIDMNSVAGMADKLFDVEGAVDMSAQLQVLGGAWAKMADPFHLMYMARNDMEGLTKEIGEAAASSARFNAQNKDFEISAMEMHRLRKVAEQTGVDYDTLATAAKNAAKFTNVRKQVHYGFDKDTKEFIENTAQFNEKGEAVININGQPKLVKQLNSTDETMLKSMIAEKKSLKDRAEAAQTFDEKITNLVNQFKQLLLPFVTALDAAFRPVVNKLVEVLKKPEVINAIKKVADIAAKAMEYIGNFIANNPGKAIIGAIAGIGLFEAAKWFLSGTILGKGFLTSVKGFGGGGGGGGFGGGGGGGGAAEGEGMISSFLRGGAKGGTRRNMLAAGKNFGRKGIGKGLLGLGGKLATGLEVAEPLGLVGLGLEAGRGMMDNQDSALGKGLGIGASTADWAAGGALLGSMFGPLGTIVGGVGGGLIGAGKGIYDEYYSDEAKKKAELTKMNVHDGIMFDDRDKFLKLNDGAMIAGTNVNGNKDLAKAITGNETSKSVKIEFGEIHFKFDELKVTSPGSPGLAVDLLKDPMFIRKITTMIHSETEKVIQGGKNK
jgi:hypothetical protein